MRREPIDWQAVFAARCRSKEGRSSEEDRRLCQRAHREDPARYAASSDDVFDATVPFGSQARAVRRSISVDSSAATAQSDPIMTTETKPVAIKAGDRVKVLKGTTARVDSITELGAEYSHSVRVSFTILNGFKAGRSFVFFARHANRLADAVITMNDGNPTHTIQLARS